MGLDPFWTFLTNVNKLKTYIRESVNISRVKFAQIKCSPLTLLQSTIYVYIILQEYRGKKWAISVQIC